MTRPLLGPNKDARGPKSSPPHRACDCHIHVAAPLKKYSMIAERGYTPPQSTLADYRYTLSILGIKPAVIIQPSIFRTDNRATLEALQDWEIDEDEWHAILVANPAMIYGFNGAVASDLESA